MSKKNLMAFFGWGVVLWLIGYVLGFVLFAFVPTSLIGWIIMPIGVALALWILFKKIELESFKNYFWLGLVWAVIAIIFDYFFLVKLLKPADGYYKPDVYLYYLLTFLLPVLVGFLKTNKRK